MSSDSIDRGANAARSGGPAEPEDAWSNGDTCPFGKYKGQKGELTWAVDGKHADRQPGRLPPAGRRDDRDRLPARRARSCAFPPDACTSFANISDQQTAAVVSKNSPCRRRPPRPTTSTEPDHHPRRSPHGSRYRAARPRLVRRSTCARTRLWHCKTARVRVLVTGGAGFIGSTLVDRLLAEGCDVDAIDDLSTGVARATSPTRARTATASSRSTGSTSASPQLADLVAHRRPEVIFHLAAQLDVRVSVARPMFDAEVNILGSLNVCEAALGAGTRKVVFAGSGGTLYGVPESVPVREGHPQRPISPYGVSKKAAGDYLHYYREVHGLEYTELALANVYGPRQDPHGEAGVVAIFAGQLLAGKQPTIYGDGSQTRDFVFVDDVVDAFVRAAEKGGGLLMNIGTGVETSVLELYDADGRAHRLPRPGRATRPTPGRARALRARPRPRRDPPRLEAVDRRSTTASPSPSTGSATVGASVARGATRAGRSRPECV